MGKETTVAKEYDLSEFKARVAERLQNPATAAVPDVVDAVLQEIAYGTATHGRMDLHNFGVFKLKQRAARSGTAPDGTAWSTPARYQVTFKASPLFRRIVEEVTEIPAI